MFNESAYKLGRHFGKKLIEIAEVPEKDKREYALNSTALVLSKVGKYLQAAIPDKLECRFLIRDIKLGVDVAIAESQKTKVLH